MERSLLDVFLLDENRLFPRSSSYPPLPRKIREDGGRMVIIVSCGPDTAFTCSFSSAAAQEHDMIWCDRFCFKGFGEKNKGIGFCGLIAACGLGGRGRSACVR